MSLARSIKLISVSTDGKTITIQETTGAYNVSTNPGGFGTPNPAISTFTTMLITGLYVNQTLIYLVITNSGTVQVFLGGDPQVLALTSELSPGVTGSFPFVDGVLKLTSYAKQASVTISGLEGNAFITGAANLTPFLTAEYVITPDNAIYQIDTDNVSNTTSKVYLKTSILVDFAAGCPAFAASCYAMVKAEFSCKLVNAIAAMAGHGGDEDDKAGILADMLVKNYAADFDFIAKDYIGADYALRSGINRLNRLHHG